MSISPMQLAEILEVPVELLVIVPSESLPCVVVARSRPYLCVNLDDHEADWEILFNCGCTHGYCNNAWDHMRPLEFGAPIMLPLPWVSKRLIRGFFCPIHEKPSGVLLVRPVRKLES